MSTRSSPSPGSTADGARAADGPAEGGSARAARGLPDSADGFRRRTGRKLLFILASLLVLIALTVLGVYAGAADLQLAEIGRALVSVALPFLGIEAERTTVSILWELRLPRVVMAVLAGAGLGLAGATMQGVLRNPLTSLASNTPRFRAWLFTLEMTTPRVSSSRRFNLAK